MITKDLPGDDVTNKTVFKLVEYQNEHQLVKMNILNF